MRRTYFTHILFLTQTKFTDVKLRTSEMHNGPKWWQLYFNLFQNTKLSDYLLLTWVYFLHCKWIQKLLLIFLEHGFEGQRFAYYLMERFHFVDHCWIVLHVESCAWCTKWVRRHSLIQNLICSSSLPPALYGVKPFITPL